MMKWDNQDRRRLPVVVYVTGVTAVMVVVGFSALVQSRTRSADAVGCDVLPVIRAVDEAQGAAPERLQITVVGRRAAEVIRARAEVAQPGRPTGT
jgi:hypothetical protein